MVGGIKMSFWLCYLDTNSGQEVVKLKRGAEERVTQGQNVANGGGRGIFQVVHHLDLFRKSKWTLKPLQPCRAAQRLSGGTRQCRGGSYNHLSEFNQESHGFRWKMGVYFLRKQWIIKWIIFLFLLRLPGSSEPNSHLTFSNYVRPCDLYICVINSP